MAPLWALGAVFGDAAVNQHAFYYFDHDVHAAVYKDCAILMSPTVVVAALCAALLLATLALLSHVALAGARVFLKAVAEVVHP